MKNRQIHRLKCYSLDPDAILSLSYSKLKSTIAALRNNRIELWNIAAVPFLQGTVFLDNNLKLRSLSWCGERLFGADLQGFVREFDVLSLQEKASFPVSSGACHCLAISPDNSLLAAGTESGYINILDVADNSLEIKRLLECRMRALTVCWNKSGELLAAGSVDNIFVWKVGNGSIIHTLKVPRRFKHVPVIVWCLTFTEDDAVASGDSSGRFNIWDVATGTCVQSFNDHDADILALSVSGDKQRIYTTGVDSKIQLYNRVYFQKKNKVEWIRSGNFKYHSNDVNSIVACEDDIVFTGGVDSFLTAAKFYPFVFQRYLPLLENRCVSICSSARCALVRYQKHLELWKLPSSSSSDSSPVKLIELQSIDGEMILTSSASNDAKWIAYSTNSTFRLLQVDLTKDYPQLLPAHLSAMNLRKAHHIIFSENGKVLVAADSNSLIQVICTETLQTKYSIDLEGNKNFSNDRLTVLAVNFDGTYISATGTRGQIVVWHEGEFSSKVPLYQKPVTAMAFSPHGKDKPLLYAVYSDFFFIEYHVNRKKYSEFTREVPMNVVMKHLNSDNLPVSNVAFDASEKNVFILQKASIICAIDKKRVGRLENNEAKFVEEKSPNKKRMKMDNSLEFDDQNESNQKQGNLKRNLLESQALRAPDYNFEKAKTFMISRKKKDLNANQSEDPGVNVFMKYENLVHFGSFGKQEMLSVEISMPSMYNKLPPVLKTKKFGRN